MRAQVTSPILTFHLSTAIEILTTTYENYDVWYLLVSRDSEPRQIFSAQL